MADRRQRAAETRLLRQAFARALKSLRNAKEMTQEDLASAADYDSTYISKLERGGYNPTLHFIMKASKGLKIYPEEMLEAVRAELKQMDGRVAEWLLL
jgi:transcriptional regulator with XRE-family HTH domain